MDAEQLSRIGRIGPTDVNTADRPISVLTRKILHGSVPQAAKIVVQKLLAKDGSRNY
jgi:hypothetical protein